jgi:hypothetical protein
MSNYFNFKIDFDQLLLIIKKCNLKQKVAIVDSIKNETHKKRFDKLMAELKNNDLTPNDINREVDLVRQKRYEKKPS